MYYNPLCNYASALVRDARMAQDIVHDVFERLWENKSNLNTMVNEKGYLFKAVRNRAVEIIKKQRLDQDTVIKAALLNNDGNFGQKEDMYLQKEMLYRAIKALPPKCSKVFTMSKLQGLTYREIAEELNVSVKTVENHIGKALRLLREMLNENKSSVLLR